MPTPIEPLSLSPLVLGDFQSTDTLQNLTLAHSLPPGRASILSTINERLRGLHWDRYDLLYPLGCGGMGCVYLARDRRLDRRVAIKFLYGQDADASERYLEEARTQARIEHPRVCRVYEAGEIQGMPYIVMQLVEGRPMDLAMQGLPLEQRVHLLRMTTEAVHAAHHQGLVHRDLKPGNILLAPDEDGVLRPVVLDFGLARDQELLQESLHGLAKGTPAYMSPEQARGDLANLDRRTDIFSLGVVAYQMLTDHLPFDGSQGLSVLLDQLRIGPPDPRLHRPDLPEDLICILQKCLRWDPAQRYDSMRALGEDLRRFMDGEPVSARRVGRTERLLMWVRRNRLLAASLSLAAVSVLGAATVLAVGRVRAQMRTAHAIAFSRAVETLELDLSAVRMSPIPLGSVPQEIQRQLLQIQQEANTARGLMRGPAQAALGRARLAMDHPARAIVAFREALASGYRPMEVQVGLATALAMELQKHQQLIGSLDQALQADRFATAEAELVRQVQTQLGGEPLAQELVSRARWNLLHQRFQETQALLEPALASSPWRQDLQRLWCETLVTEHSRDLFRGKAHGERLPRILAALAQARQRIPGDPFYWVKEGELRLAEARFHGKLNDPATTEPLWTCVQQALLQWQDYAPALLLAAEVRHAQTRWLLSQERDARAFQAEATDFAQRLLAQHPDQPSAHYILFRLGGTGVGNALAPPQGQDPSPLLRDMETHRAALLTQVPWMQAITATELAWAHYSHALWLLRTERDPLPAIQTGLDLVTQGLQAHPRWSLPLNARAALLHVRSRLEKDPTASLQQGAEDLLACIRLSPASPGAHFNRALRFIDLAVYRQECLGIDARAEVEEAERMAHAFLALTPGDDSGQHLLAATTCLRCLQALRSGTGDPAATTRSIAWLGTLRPPLRSTFEVMARIAEADAAYLEGRNPAPSFARARLALARAVASPSALHSAELSLLVVDIRAHLEVGPPPLALISQAHRLIGQMREALDQNRQRELVEMEVRLDLAEVVARPEARVSLLAKAESATSTFTSTWRGSPRPLLLRSETALHRARYLGQPPPPGLLKDLEHLSHPGNPQTLAARHLLTRFQRLGMTPDRN